MATRDEILEDRIKGIKGYPYGRYVYRLQTENQIKILFNDPKIKPKTNVYYGMIGRIEAAIYFNIGTNPSIHAKTQENLDQVYKVFQIKYTALTK